MVECEFNMAELNVIRDGLIERVQKGGCDPYRMAVVIAVFKKVENLMEQNRCK